MVTATKAVPTTADELEEYLNDEKNVDTAFADPASAKEFIENYRRAANDADPDLQKQAKDQQEKVLADFLEKNGYTPEVKRLPMDENANGTHPVYKGMGLDRNEARKVAATGAGPGTEISGKYDRFGDFVKDVWHGNRNPSEHRKILGESEGDAGGFLVPEEFRAELLRIGLETAVVRPRARVIPMTRQTVSIPAIRDASHASTVYGGISANWAAEGADVSSNTNEPTFAQARLDAKKLTAYTVAGNELLADSAISLEATLMELFPEAISYFEDDAFIAGVGGGQPLGVLNADAIISVAKETGQAANTIQWENLVKMFSRQLPSSMNRSVWYAHPDTFPQLATMSLTVGTGGSAVWLANGVGGPPTSILGRPVIFTEKAETLGTAGDIVLADFSYYLIGDRQSMTVASSPHVQFINDRTVWRFIQRVDGRPWLDTALTPRNGSNTLSPFVSLATRA